MSIVSRTARVANESPSRTVCSLFSEDRRQGIQHSGGSTSSRVGVIVGSRSGREQKEVGRPQSHVSRDDRPISGSLAASLLRGYPRAVAARSSLLNCVTRRTVSTASPTASYTPTSVLHLPVPLIARRYRIARARTARHSLSASDGFYSGVDHRQFRRARKKEKPSSHAEHRIITILSLCLETTTDSLPTVQFPCRK